MHTPPFTLLLSAALFCFSPHALAIYKCEAAGKVVYSDMRCQGTGGTMKEVAVAAPLSDADSAQQRAVQNRKELDRIEAARDKQNALDEKDRQRAAKAQQARKKKCSDLALRAKWANEDAAHAAGKTGAKAARNAQRATEKYHAACDVQS